MFVRIICTALAVSAVLSDNVKDELEAVYNLSRGEPYSELPCLIIGGSCAKADSCPQDTRVQTKGLCPVQQADGIECCKREARTSKSYTDSESSGVRCRSRGGSCESLDEVTCGQELTVREATDCGHNEVCCIFT